MKVYCVATLDNKSQVDKLCGSICFIGGDPKVSNTEVSVDFEGENEECEAIIQLFEYYSRHSIYSESTT